MQKILEENKSFYKDLEARTEFVDKFSKQYRLNKYDIQMLMIIVERETVLLREILVKELMKKNQVNKSVKNLYDAKLITKVRLPHDERTVELGIRDDSKEKVLEIIKSFNNAMKKFNM